MIFSCHCHCLQACRLQSERENDRTEAQAWQTQLLQQVAALKGQQQQQQRHAATAAASIAAESAAVRSGAEGLAEEVSLRQRALLANMAALVTDIEGYRCASMMVHDEALHMTGAVSANQWCFLVFLQTNGVNSAAFVSSACITQRFLPLQ